MATGNSPRASAFSIGLRLVSFLVVIGALVWFFFGTAITGFSKAGTGYAARTTCSCLYVAQREMDSCKSDLTAGMSLIWLNDDAENQSVSASVPLIASTTASYLEGYGCVQEKWGG